MAMNKKGARKIVVDGQLFYWKVWNYDGGYDLFDDYNMIIIESDEFPDYQIVRYYSEFYLDNITPSIIRQMIELALGTGWKPGVGKMKSFDNKEVWNQLKFKKKAIWKPEFYKRKQSLKIGEVEEFYINGKMQLYFSWGEYNHKTDYKASFQIDKLVHSKYGEVLRIESEGNLFKIGLTNREETFCLDEVNPEDWILQAELSEFRELPPVKLV